VITADERHRRKNPAAIGCKSLDAKGGFGLGDGRCWIARRGSDVSSIEDNQAGDLALMPQDAGQPTAVLESAPDQAAGRLASAPAPTTFADRLRLRMPAPTPPPALPEAGEAAVLPFDSTKVFVGPNGTYYDERWRWMEWRGRNRSWNWAAALTLGGWLAYRRLYALAALCLGWVGVVALMLLHHIFLPLMVAAHLGVAIAVGVFGNRLYLANFRRAAFAVARQHEGYAARVAALAGKGGVDRRAAWLWSLAAVGLAGLVIALDR
jgi:hypothetical protein